MVDFVHIRQFLVHETARAYVSGGAPSAALEPLLHHDTDIVTVDYIADALLPDGLSAFCLHSVQYGGHFCQKIFPRLLGVYG